MEKIDNPSGGNIRISCPKYISWNIPIIAIASAAFCFFNCWVFFPIFAYETMWMIIIFCAVFSCLLMLAMGIVCCIASSKDAGKWVWTYYLLAGTWALFYLEINMILGFAGSFSSTEDFYQSVIFISLAICFLGCFVLLLIASIRMKKGKSFKQIGVASSICFMTFCVFNFFSMSIGVSSIAFLYYLASFGVLSIGVLLFLCSIKSRYVSEEDEKMMEEAKPIPPVKDIDSHGKSEDERISLLKGYKDLLDSGAITQEEYEKKKKDILGE